MATSRKTAISVVLVILLVGCSFVAGRLSTVSWSSTVTQTQPEARPIFKITVDNGKISGIVDTAITAAQGTSIIPANTPLDLPLASTPELSFYSEHFMGTITFGASVAQAAAPTTQTCAVQTSTPSATDIIASSKGTKYYFANCSEAKKIKAENIVHFSSESEAKQAGYQPSQCVTTRATL